MKIGFGKLKPWECEHRRVKVTHTNDLMITWECTVCGTTVSTPTKWLENTAKRAMRQQTHPRTWDSIVDDDGN